MKMGSTEYMHALRKANELESLAILTLAQEIELAHLNTRLTAAAMQGESSGEAIRELKRELIECLVDDYAQCLAMGDLSGAEL